MEELIIMIERLLECSELNMEDLEPETIKVIDDANELITGYL